jgi:hypothetical protein
VARILPIDTPTLGDRSYLVHDGRVAFVVDPQRDVDRVPDLAAAQGVRTGHSIVAVDDDFDRARAEGRLEGLLAP